jgi:serine/threonine-protein kinase
MGEIGLKGAKKTMPADQRQLTRAEQRDQRSEGGLAPVVFALVLSTVVGTVLGWFVLSPNKSVQRPTAPRSERILRGSVQLTRARQQRELLLSRLRALQVDRTWFLMLVDSAFLKLHPERSGRLPSDAPEDIKLRRIWADLAQEWLARVERLPPSLRARLGSFSDSDWRGSSRRLTDQGIHPLVLERLVGAAPAEPFRQFWIATAMRTLDDLRVKTVEAQSGEVLNRSLRVPAKSALVVALSLPPEQKFSLALDGTPLMQMSLFGADGILLEKHGPLRSVRLDFGLASHLQLLVTNDGVASGRFSLSIESGGNGRVRL